MSLPLKQKELNVYRDLLSAFDKFEERHYVLPGIVHQDRRHVLCCQIVESLRRGRYIKAISSRLASPLRADPTSNLFDPEMAAVFHRNTGNIEEAFWLSFLAIHFGKNKKFGWSTLKNFYRKDGLDGYWTWEEAFNQPKLLDNWLIENWQRINFGFGNHRKYESLNPAAKNSTNRVLESYFDWIRPFGSHANLIESAYNITKGKPEELFDHFYKLLSKVKRFGRLGKFDYLCLIGHLNLININANSLYLNNATGPLKGAYLLFENKMEGTSSPSAIEQKALLLNQFLNIGMQPLEDALCNWQKSPSIFTAFRG